MAKTFTKFGLKRSNNLSDVPNKEQALNNILLDLKGNKPSFTVEDLECLQELFPKGITSADFQNLADIAVKFLTTQETEDLPVGSKVSFEPLVTLENRFDRAYFTVSDPFFYGGEGLTARYFDNDQIDRAGTGNATENFIGFTGEELTLDNKWEDGNFAYSNKITSEFISLYGAVQWTGYFKPVVSGTHQFSITTTGFYKFEFDDGTGNFDFTFDAATGTYNYNNNNFSSGLTTLRNESKVDSNFDIITVDQLGAASTLTDVKIGDQRSRTITIPYPLAEWNAYKIRITFFIDEISIFEPEQNLFSIEKLFNIDVIDPSSATNRDLNFKQLYDELYFNNYIIGDFKDYVDKSVYFGGTKIGNRGTIGKAKTTTNGDNYANVSTLSPVTSYYTPPKTVSDISITKSQCSYSNTNRIITFNNAADANKTENIEVGNYVIGTGIPDDTRVQEVIINNSIIIDKTPTQTLSNQSISFIDHRGFVAHGTASTTNGSNVVTASFSTINNNDIPLGSVIILANYSGTDYVRLMSTTYNAPTLSYFLNLTRNMSATSANVRAYVYYDSGLVNESLKTFCTGVLAKRIVQASGQPSGSDYTYNPGSTNITLSDVTGLSNGMYIHLYPATPYQIFTIDGVDEIRSTSTITNVNTVTNTITISPGLLSSITYTPATTTKMTFTPSTVNVNKEVCFVPTDTSPPFSANSEGLATSETVNLVSAYQGSVNTSSEVVYDNLYITCSPSQVISTTGSDTVTHLLPIRDRNNVQYNILLGS